MVGTAQLRPSQVWAPVEYPVKPLIAVIYAAHTLENPSLTHADLPPAIVVPALHPADKFRLIHGIERALAASFWSMYRSSPEGVLVRRRVDHSRTFPATIVDDDASFQEAKYDIERYEPRVQEFDSFNDYQAFMLQTQDDYKSLVPLDDLLRHRTRGHRPLDDLWREVPKHVARMHTKPAIPGNCYFSNSLL